MSNKFLIIGSTGNIGRSVVENLQQQGISLLLGARNPKNPQPVETISQVYFDYDDPGSWPDSLAGVNRVFMIPKVGDPCPDKTLMPFMDLAKQSGVERIVFSTAMGLDSDWRVLAAAEEHLLDSGLAFTILRPGWFMQNFTSGYQRAGILDGMIALPGSGDCKLSLIDTRDIGACAAIAMLKDEHIGRIYTLTGPEALSWNQITAMLGKASGHDVRYVNSPEKPIRDFLLANGTPPYRVEQMMLMMRSMRDGVFAEVTHNIEKILGRPAISFSQHLAEYGHLLVK